MAGVRVTVLALLVFAALVSSFLVSPRLIAEAQVGDTDRVDVLDPEQLAPPRPDNRVTSFSPAPELPTGDDLPKTPSEDRVPGIPQCDGLTDDRPFLDQPDHSLVAAGPEDVAAISFQGSDLANPQTDLAGSSPATAALIATGARVFFTDQGVLCLGTYGRWYEYDDVSVRCAATLIDPEWVLTAAHCVSNHKPTGVSGMVGIIEHHVHVRLGSTEWDSGGDLYEVIETHIHPDWSRQVFDDGTWLNDAETWTGDLALLRISTPAMQRPAGLHALLGTELAVEQSTRGWGINEQGEVPATRLWWTNNLVDDAHCESHDSTGAYVAEDSLCVDALDGFGACFGDSGSAIGTTDLATETFALTGVASYIILTGAEGPNLTPCDDPRYVAYTHIDGPRLDWVLETIE